MPVKLDDSDLFVGLDDSDLVIGPDDEPPNRKHRTGRGRAKRLRPLPGSYVRVPIQWLVESHFESSFNAEVRLHLYLLYRSHWGQKEVAVTAAFAAKLGLPRRTCQDALGWVQVQRHKGCAPVVLPVVLSVLKTPEGARKTVHRCTENQ